MIRVGLIGAGFIGRNHFNQYELMPDKARVVAICDPEPDRRAGDWSKVGGNVADARGTVRDLGDIRRYADYRELIADDGVDMIDICAPTHLHAEIAIAGLKSGRHVLSEKPMGLSVEQCDTMLAAAGGAKGRFMIAQCIRFWPQYVFLKQVVDDRRFGALKALHLRRQASAPDYSLNNWILNPELSGGAILDLHAHDVDYALYLLGMPRSVRAQSYPRAGGGYDRVHALWDYDDCPVVQLEGFWDMPPGFGFNCGFTAVFEKAAIVWELAGDKPLTVFRQDGQQETPEITGRDGYFTEIAYFLDCIARGDAPAVSTPEQSRLAVALALAERDSASRGAPVDVSGLGKVTSSGGRR